MREEIKSGQWSAVSGQLKLAWKDSSRLLSAACCLLIFAFCFLPSAFAGTHVTGVYSVGASPAVMATVNGNSEYGLVFAQRNNTVTYNNILYVNNIVTAYFDVNGNLNDGKGNAWIDLIPDANAAPGDSYYVVTINIQGSIHSEIWIVPDQTSAGVLSVRQTTAPPSGTVNFFYQTLQQSGASLAQRPTLNFSGAGISCLDNSGLQRTDCTMTASGFANPMTSPGDLIVGGAAGAATRLALGSNSLCLTSNGATAVWASCSAGSGTVTSFSAGTLAPLFTTSVATATTTPALTFALTNQNANLLYAGPSSGAAAAATFRGLVGADLPNPSASTLGGIESMTAVASKWINAISSSGVPSATQPMFTDVGGSLASGQLPAGWNPVSAPNGGSGVVSPTAHLVLVAEGASPFAPVPAGTAGQALISNGAGADPTFQDPIVSGPDAVGVAPTKNPVQVGCLFLTTPATLLNNQVGAAQCDSTQNILTHVTNTVAVSGTFWQATQPVSAATLPLPTGASTAAKQPALGTAGVASADVLTVQGIAAMTALKVDGSAVTQPVSGTVTANAGTNLNTSLLQLDATGAKLNVAQSAALGTNTGPLIQASVTTAAPTYTTGNINPLSLNVSGGLRVDGSGSTQPVSGTVAATESGTWTVQPGNTANTTAWKVDGSAVTQPVSGTVTANAGTGSFTVAQATAANLNATVTGTVTTTPPANASTNISQIGGTAVVADPCQANVKLYVSINQTAGAQLVTGTAAKKIYPCSINLVSATAQNVALVEGTGTVCATGTSGVLGFGGSTAATGWNLSANGGLTYGDGRGALGQEGVAADNLCLVQSGTGQISGGLSYVVQ